MEAYYALQIVWLLHLDHKAARADGVGNAALHEYAVTLLHGDLMEHIQHGGNVLAVKNVAPALGRNALLEADINVRILVAGKEIPALGLAVFGIEKFLRERSRRMHLDHKALCGIKKLDEASCFSFADLSDLSAVLDFSVALGDILSAGVEGLHERGRPVLGKMCILRRFLA